MKPTFLSLPVEIRFQIYSLLMTTRAICVTNDAVYSARSDLSSPFGLLTVNRQISHEVRTMSGPLTLDIHPTGRYWLGEETALLQVSNFIAHHAALLGQLNVLHFTKRRYCHSSRHPEEVCFRQQDWFSCVSFNASQRVLAEAIHALPNLSRLKLSMNQVFGHGKCSLKQLHETTTRTALKLRLENIAHRSAKYAVQENSQETRKWKINFGIDEKVAKEKPDSQDHGRKEGQVLLMSVSKGSRRRNELRYSEEYIGAWVTVKATCRDKGLQAR